MTSTTSLMSSEIAEQPEALRRTFADLLPLRAEIEALGRSTKHVLFIARGSSDNAAVYGSYLLQAHTGRLATLGSPSIATAYGARIDLSDVLAVAISQSGKTEEIVETMRWAADCGARTVGVTNGADSPLAAEADVALVTRAGNEVAVPATKTYNTQLAALAVLALGLGADLDPGELDLVPEGIEQTLAAPADALEEIVERMVAVQGAVISGRGMAFSTALEAALKLKEACYLHAMGLSYADLLHGPIAVVDPRTPALLVAAPDGPTLQGTVALAERARSAGAPVFGFGGGAALAAASDLSVPVPDVPEWVSPMNLIVPAQLLTEHLARRLGYDPDVPRGLNKVTQTS
ncbi:glutamine-fructose-6-phosphate transaminase [Nocardiopsis terrae]|uniref:Glucosamine--fructose-6-phosphate aminotransferase (Isomerizing) n=1 Tax=Nocardiopsis terrae TaxID=372655 RepID=A0ABR9HCU2_9ACTN|nr:SIS domain-containing protein [Nocardiopsis terrae]MBE1456615.1 glucosamine--fructose-6-phosphate aminotransferase (isomerizing) [Nocardiopsis terrae]GHC75941.1 glutamine-fructose-6-phosphate transaminase [Nocardiopsis terrae]